MKIVAPSSIISAFTPDMLQVIEKAGRTCYKSEDKITDESASKFIKNLIKSGHESVLEHGVVAVRFICDRGVTHELVRHRLASYSQESTRYCNYSKDKFDKSISVIDIASGFKYDLNNPYDYTKYEIWRIAMNDAELSYHKMLKAGATPQEARSVLPNSLKTEIVMTANVREWRQIFNQRCSKSAHPQIREIMLPLLGECYNRWPVLFKDVYFKFEGDIQ